jgi:hypothetical protein
MRRSSASIHDFAVTPPPAYAWAILLVIFVLFIVVGGLAYRQHGPLAFLATLVPTIALLGMRRRSVSLGNGMLEVRAAFYRKRIALAELDLQRARVVDLAEHTQLQPRLRTNGYAIPGFYAGHFRLRDKRKAFCLITDRHRVLWLPLHDGSQLLLSLKQPQALLDALRTAT